MAANFFHTDNGELTKPPKIGPMRPPAEINPPSRNPFAEPAAKFGQMLFDRKKTITL